MESRSGFERLFILFATVCVIAAVVWVYLYPLTQKAKKPEEPTVSEVYVEKEIFEKADKLEGKEIQLKDTPGETDKNPFN